MVHTITEIAALIIALGGAGTVVYRSWQIINTQVDRVLYELSDNSGGSFKDWVKAEFHVINEKFDAVQEFQEGSAADRQLLHRENQALDQKFTEEIARTKLAERGVVDDRDGDDDR